MFTRRTFVKLTALGLGTVAIGFPLRTAVGQSAAPTPNTQVLAPTTENEQSEEDARLSPRQRSHFGLLFPRLPGYIVPDDKLSALAETMRDRAAGSPLGDNLFYDPAGSQTVPTSFITAGMTYVGQFLDHDLDRDDTPLAVAQGNPNDVINARQPALNLDSVYGMGAVFTDKGRFYLPLNQFGVVDYPRDSRGFALIADFRNDENLVLQPIQLSIMKFHNALLDKGHVRSFKQARRLTRWYYQWMILTEHLPAIMSQEETNKFIRFRPGQVPEIRSRFGYKPGTPPRMMPAEFAMACYRLHTMVRNNYTIRRGTRIGIFNTVPLNLVGGRPVPPELVQESDLFFRMDTSPPFDGPNVQAGAQSFNVSRRMDASISPQLYNLPAFALPNSPEFSNLPVRNLIRGTRLNMTSGQDLAKALGIKPLTNAELDQNAANVAGGLHGLTDPAFQDKAPMWFYFNKESEIATGGRHLGPVGAAIVGEVVTGLIANDRTSFVNKGQNRDDDGDDARDPRPFSPKTPIATVNGRFTFADLLKYAG